MKVKWAAVGIAAIMVIAPLTYLVLQTELVASFYRPSVNVQTIAMGITVRLINDLGAGSGVIIARSNGKYTVLTNAHVLNLLDDRPFQVLTFDGRLHVGSHQKDRRLAGLDLAIVTFSSPHHYEVAQFSSTPIRPNIKIYAAGFPNYRTTRTNGIEDTRSWGLKAFRCTEGFFVMELRGKALAGGYKLGYSNEVELGMSGGPVLDAYGRLVGVNGRLKYPIQGIDSFAFTDGSLPSQELFQQMEPLSWGVPISFLETNEDSI